MTESKPTVKLYFNLIEITASIWIWTPNDDNQTIKKADKQKKTNNKFPNQQLNYEPWRHKQHPLCTLMDASTRHSTRSRFIFIDSLSYTLSLTI